jgi:hypothetical protein
MATSGWQKLRRDLIVSLGSLLFIIGIFAVILLSVSVAEDQKALWVAAALTVAASGWVIARTQSTGLFDTFKQMLEQLLTIILSPLNWF